MFISIVFTVQYSCVKVKSFGVLVLALLFTSLWFGIVNLESHLGQLACCPVCYNLQHDSLCSIFFNMQLL